MGCPEAGDAAVHRRCRTTKPGAAAGSSGRYVMGETALAPIRAGHPLGAWNEPVLAVRYLVPWGSSPCKGQQENPRCPRPRGHVRLPQVGLPAQGVSHHPLAFPSNPLQARQWHSVRMERPSKRDHPLRRRVRGGISSLFQSPDAAADAASPKRLDHLASLFTRAADEFRRRQGHLEDRHSTYPPRGAVSRHGLQSALCR